MSRLVRNKIGFSEAILEYSRNWKMRSGLCSERSAKCTFSMKKSRSGARRVDSSKTSFRTSGFAAKTCCTILTHEGTSLLLFPYFHYPRSKLVPFIVPQLYSCLFAWLPICFTVLLPLYRTFSAARSPLTHSWSKTGIQEWFTGEVNEVDFLQRKQIWTQVAK